VAVGASRIYWSDDSGPSDGAIMAANLDGTGVTTLVTGLNHPSGVAVDASHLYWAETAAIRSWRPT
jgi:Low-density lipoprotein receptor repeat class B